MNRPNKKVQWKSTGELKGQVLKEAPTPPKKGILRFILGFLSLAIVVWSFNGADFNFIELFKESPKIGATIQRMLPPDMSSLGFPKKYKLRPELVKTLAIADSNANQRIDSDAEHSQFLLESDPYETRLNQEEGAVVKLYNLMEQTQADNTRADLQAEQSTQTNVLKQNFPELTDLSFNGMEKALAQIAEEKEFIKAFKRYYEPLTFQQTNSVSWARVPAFQETYKFPNLLKAHQLFIPVGLNQAQADASRKWWNNVFPGTVLGATIQTIQMALAGTVIAVFIAFPLSFLAAANTSPHPVIYQSVRFVINLLRTIPDLALGLIFVAAVGLGPFAGTMALAVHTMTVLTKLLSESVENIDGGVVEAIRATGANYYQTLSFAVLPQMLPDLISFTLYRFETNIRAASVLGLIGAGGIGQLLNSAFKTFEYQEAATIVAILIILVMLVDAFSARLRRWVL